MPAILPHGTLQYRILTEKTAHFSYYSIVLTPFHESEHFLCCSMADIHCYIQIAYMSDGYNMHSASYPFVSNRSTYAIIFH